MELWTFHNQLANRQFLSPKKKGKSSQRKGTDHTKTSSWSRRSCLLCLDRWADARLESILHTIEVKPTSTSCLEVRCCNNFKFTTKVLWGWSRSYLKISYSQCQNMSPTTCFTHPSFTFQPCSRTCSCLDPRAWLTRTRSSLHEYVVMFIAVYGLKGTNTRHQK